MLAITDQNRKWWILIAMGVCGGLIMLDETVVGIALPTLRRELAMSELASHWVISVYMLVFAGTAAAGGRIGDMVGFRALLLVGAALFGLASLACGFAADGPFLIAARAIQGLGAAAIFPATVAMIMIVFPKDQRGMAMGTLAAMGTVFLASGPLVGGLLTEIISWRWIFWINIPIVAAVAAIVTAAWTESSRESVQGPFDIGGLATLVGGITLLVFAIMQGASWGWTQGLIVGAFAVGVGLLATFVLLESRRTAPLINVELFRDGSFAACNLIVFTGQFTKISIVVFGALYLQQRLGMNPLMAGLALLVAVAGFPVLSVPVGRIADRLGARHLVLAGLAAATLAMFWIALAAGWTSYLLLVPGLLVWGLGMPFVYAPTLRAMANSVPKEKQGQVGGIGVTLRLLGGTVSMAFGSTLLVMSGSFQAVFLATAIVMLVALLFGWYAITIDEDVEPSPAHHQMRFWGHS